jgi:hypothetical protein
MRHEHAYELGGSRPPWSRQTHVGDHPAIASIHVQIRELVDRREVGETAYGRHVGQLHFRAVQSCPTFKGLALCKQFASGVLSKSTGAAVMARMAARAAIRSMAPPIEAVTLH